MVNPGDGAPYWRRLLADGGEVSPIEDAGYWHIRAMEARSIGRSCEDALSAQIMFDLADAFDQLAVKYWR